MQSIDNHPCDCCACAPGVTVADHWWACAACAEAILQAIAAEGLCAKKPYPARLSAVLKARRKEK